MGSCTIVMYHYVRDVGGTRFPGINARSVDAFESQLDHLENHYEIVGYEDLLAALTGTSSLPDRAAMLTFDDGLCDHFETVFPILQRRDLPGFFFPPSVPIETNTLLTVHKIHAILASSENHDPLIERLDGLVDQFAETFDLEEPAAYYDRLAEPGRWDPPEVVYIKRLLQRELPEPVRSRVASKLLETFVETEEATLAEEWYMSSGQLRTMVDHGMYVGSHGANHYWLDAKDAEQTRAEIESSLSFLDRIGATTQDWIMCYPYGAYDSQTVDLLREHGCLAGLTTEWGVADVGTDDSLTLPRIDTNDLPVPGP